MKTNVKPSVKVGADDIDATKRLHLCVKALRQVSFYARINHGTKCKDYGEVVDPVLKALGQPTGEL